MTPAARKLLRRFKRDTRGKKFVKLTHCMQPDDLGKICLAIYVFCRDDDLDQGIKIEMMPEQELYEKVYDHVTTRVFDKEECRLLKQKGRLMDILVKPGRGAMVAEPDLESHETISHAIH